MRSEWPEISIDELKAPSKNAIAMGPFGSRIKAENFVSEGVPVIKGGNLNGDFLLEDSFDYLTLEKADELSSSNAFRRDIVITHRGTIGQVGIIPDNSKHKRYVVSQSQLKVTLDQNKVNPYFIYYFLRSPLGQHRLLMNAAQVGVPAIAQASTSVKAILVPFPDRRVQDQIVDLLLSLDKKIGVNIQTNQTLEQIAQAIFKSWFVDFDPVKAKIAVLEAGGTVKQAELAAMSAISAKDEFTLKQLQAEQPAAYAELAQTAALFPSAMIDSELGEIPEGWDVFALSALVNLTGGGTPKRSEPNFWGGEIPWFSVRDVPTNGNIFVIDTEEKITELGLKKSSTRLLPKGTTIITARGTVGKLALLAKDMCMNQSCYGVSGKEHGPYFNYFYLSQAVATLKQNTHGAVFDTITTSTFDTYRSSYCGKEISSRFEATITPLMEAIKNNLQENDSLSKSRDTLLPKLLSGELIGE